MGQLTILNQHGDERLEWDPADQESVERAKEEWKRLADDGYTFYEVAETKGKQVKRFSKKLGRVIAAPGVQTEADRRQGTRPKAMAGGPNALHAAVR